MLRDERHDEMVEAQHEPQDDFESAIGKLLVERGKLDRSALERALRLRNSSNEGLERLLPKLGLATERDVAQAIADHLQLPLVTARSFPDAPLTRDATDVLLVGKH